MSAVSRYSVLWVLVGAWLSGCGREPEEKMPVPEDLGPNARFADCVAEGTHTWEALGATPAPASYASVYTYDGRGWLIDLLQDTDEDVTGLALIARWDRLEDGQFSLFELDLEIDGALDTQEIVTYDEDNLPASWELDYDGDGALDEHRIYTAEEGQLATMDQDFGADGTVEVRYVYYHDELGRVTGMDGDEGLDGSLNWTARWRYRGNTDDVLRYEVNDGADRLTEYVEEHTYDDAGRETRFTISNLGGGPDEEYLYIYDPGKAEPSAAEWRTSFGGELVQLVTMTMSYDDAHRLTQRESRYSPGNAPVDLVFTETFAWDCGK